MLDEILAWGVIGVVIPVLLGVGVTVVNTRESDDLFIAKACFVLAGLIGMAKLMLLGLRSGGWGAFPLFALGITLCLWFCLEASRYVDRKREDKLAKETRTDRGAFIIRQLEQFIAEERQIEQHEGRQGPIGMLAGFSERFTFSGKVEHFLALHLSDKHVTRFREKGVYALQEMLKEFTDGTPIPVALEPVETRQASRAALEQEYEIKKLDPSFRDFGSELVPVKAYNDENGVIVQGESPNKESFSVLVRSFGNEHPAKKVGLAKRVSFGLCFICSDADAQHTPIKNVDIHRGAWLSEAETQVDFPANCPPRRAIIATIEGPGNRVYAVRRDSDSSYKNILPVREELTGSIYSIIMPFRIDSRKSGSFQYILEIVREPNVQLFLNEAVRWKSRHLGEFIDEGLAFSKRLGEIWQEVNDLFPLPKGDRPFGLVNVLLPLPAEEVDYVELRRQQSAATREREGEMIDSIKDWEMRASDWVDRFIGAGARDKILKSGPSFEVGLNRKRKSALQYMGPPLRADSEAQPPGLSYWTLSDAVSSRTNVLLDIL